MHRYAPDMAVLDRFRQRLGCEIFRTLTGVEDAASQVDCVRTVLNGGVQGFHRAGRRQKFQHKKISP